MAIVGNKEWEKHLANLCSPFYTQESGFLESGVDAFDSLDG
jgi:hypothetical protein